MQSRNKKKKKKRTVPGRTPVLEVSVAVLGGLVPDLVGWDKKRWKRKEKRKKRRAVGQKHGLAGEIEAKASKQDGTKGRHGNILRMDAPRSATPHLKVSMDAVSWRPVRRWSLPSPYAAICS